MAKNNRKKFLFERFSNQLSLLKDNNLITEDLIYDKTYICPLCLKQFSENDLEPNKTGNFLTEEDAPPASLGGNRIALTCKKCNSECGHKIDFHLKELIEDEENSKFIKGTIQRGVVDFEGKPITVEITSKGKGELEALHYDKLNNPKVFSKFLKKIVRGKKLSFKPKKSRVDSNKVNYALLKTNYIITFSKFGYIFILDESYDIIREQILNPEKEIIKYNLAVHNEHLSNHIGTHYVLDDDIKSILNIFNLRTKLTEKPFGAFLPIPNISIDNFVKAMEKKIVNNVAHFEKSEYDPSVDYFTDINEVKKLITWIG